MQLLSFISWRKVKIPSCFIVIRRHSEMNTAPLSLSLPLRLVPGVKKSFVVLCSINHLQGFA